MSRPRRDVDAATAAPFSDDAAAILLGGWSSEPPSGREHQGFGGIGFLFLPDVEFDDLWREHEKHLRALAARWAWTPAYWVAPSNEYGLRFVMGAPGEQNEGPYFYAEALAHAGPQQIGGLATKE